MTKSGALRTFATSSVLLAIGLVTSALLARWLGPTGRGEVAAILLWPSLLVYLSSMGLFPATLYFTAQPGSRTGKIIANGMIMSVAASAVAIPVGYVALHLLLSRQTPAVLGSARLYLLVVPISLATQCLVSVVQGRSLINVFNRLRLIVPIGYLVGVAVLESFGYLSPTNIVILQLGLNLVALLGSLAAVHLSSLELGWRPDLPLARKMASYGATVQLGDTSQLANLRLDQMIMAALMAPSQLGLYVVAVSAAGLPGVLSTAVRMVSTPSIARQTSAVEAVQLFQVVFRRYWIMSLTMGVALAVIQPYAIPLLFGASFTASVVPAEILLLGAMILGAKDVLSGGAQGLGDPWIGSRAELLSLPVTVVLLIVLLPSLGIMGAALASLIAYSVQLAILVWGLANSHGMSARSLLRIEIRDLRVLLNEGVDLIRKLSPATN